MNFANNINQKSIAQMQDMYLNNTPRPASAQETKKDFKDILINKQHSSSLQFSKHALARINTRNINVSDEQISRLTNMTNQAKEKGVNNALILLDNTAYVVSTKNSTVITVMDNKEKIDNVFTNIDGAIISN